MTREPGLLEELRQAADADALARGFAQVPGTLARCLAADPAPGPALGLHASLVDTTVRRALELVLADHAELAPDRFTWLALGSCGRRESALSSDIDAAVVFHDSVTTVDIARYRTAFGEVSRLLSRAGLRGDGHGVTPGNALFARTRAGWRTAARQWLADPAENKGAIMASLLVDGRTVVGEHEDAVGGVFSGLRRHPVTMRLLLREALSRRARRRSLPDLVRRRDTYDLKAHALLPIVNLARWGALAVGSPALSTVERLRAAGDTQVLPERHVDGLIEVVESLHGLRLRYQLAQVERGEPSSDLIELSRIAPADRAALRRAVRAIAAAQHRADNVIAYLDPAEWVPGR
ncbi:MAG: putative nucleotidyltransferase substrate binding domain-containing protein [Nocardioides sp.]|uniref:putative nucleotidyltransferase substrate binding domain-containing protein n=1 Tax=Nocardioides sp. TaxID=35761 RepID=UPI0039E3B7A2